MVDNFALVLMHGLLLLAVWRLIKRPDLDHELPGPPMTGDASEGKRRD